MKFPFPIKHKLSQDEFKKLCKETYIVSFDKLKELIQKFLEHKIEYGTVIEKEVYANLTVDSFIDRMVTKRPLAFVGRGDKWLLKNGKAGFGGFKEIGTEKERRGGDLVLKNLMSYDEMLISAFLSMSNSTKFYNKGDRYNCGKPMEKGTFESHGIYIAQVGARFEERFYMDYRFIIIDPEQNTRMNGYGQANYTPDGYFMELWAEFYGIPYFPSYDEVNAIIDCEQNKRFCRIPGYVKDIYFDVYVYKQRIKYNAIVFLAEANRRAKRVHKKAFAHIVGLGLGVWRIHPMQPRWYVEVYLDLLKEYKFEHIDTLYFAWNDTVTESDSDSESLINDIKIQSGKREPAEPLNDPSLLLVCNYAWDSNSYPGNEFWMGLLSDSGDPAAACCSTITYTQNPELNPHFSAKRMKYFKL